MYVIQIKKGKLYGIYDKKGNFEKQTKNKYFYNVNNIIY